MTPLQIFGVLVLLSVTIGLTLNRWRQKLPPKSTKRVVKPRPRSEAITLPQSQPLDRTIRGPYGPVRGVMGAPQPKTGIPRREQFSEEEKTDSWPPKGAA